MADITAPTNQTATAVNGVISAGMQAAEAVVEAGVLADIAAWTGPMAPIAAFFVNTFLKPVVSPLVSYIGGKFSVALQNDGTFAVIDGQVDSESSTLGQAEAAYVAAQKSGDPNAIATALKNLQAAQSALATDDGSAPAQ